MIYYMHACMLLSHLLGASKACSSRSGIGIRFLDLSFNRLSEGCCARILLGAIAGPLEGLELGEICPPVYLISPYNF
jgi:hypothetical protein